MPFAVLPTENSKVLYRGLCNPSGKRIIQPAPNREGYDLGMDAQRYQRLKQLLLQAMELDPSKHADFARRNCDDEAMREQLLRMLDHHIDDDFLGGNAVLIDEQQHAESLVGQVIGRIRIRRLLARGGMGEVFEGIDELLEREVAVKLIRQQWQLSDQRRAAFLAEARALSMLQHPNICQVYDYFAEGDRDVLVLELIRGPTLREYLDEHPTLSYRTRLDIALQIAKALVCAHEQGIAHRDLKPENVMLTQDGTVKVLDFGLARSLPNETAFATSEQATTTVSGQTTAGGTPGYIAPEQARGEPATTASDLWSFGLLLVELQTGEKPNPAVEPYARLNHVPKSLPRADRRLLTALLEPDPHRRPRAHELLQGLRSIRQRRRRRLSYAALAALLLLAIGTGTRYTLDLQHERNLAVAARTDADAARLQAENLAVFMLEDLYNGLLGVGRLDLLEPVADQAVAYFQPDPSSADGNRQRLRPESGLALMRASQVLDYQGRLDESIEVARRAVRLLDRLVSAPNADPKTRVEARYRLAQSLATLSLTLGGAARFEEAIEHAQRAVDLSSSQVPAAHLQPADASSEAPVSSEDLWQNYLNAYFTLGDAQMRAGHTEASIETLDAGVERARNAVVTYPALDKSLADLVWVRCLAFQDQTPVDGLVEACEQSLLLDRRAAELAPDDSRAAYHLSNSLWLMSEALRKSDRPADALATADEGVSIARGLVRRDPEQPRNDNLLAVNLLSRARTRDQLGQPVAMRTDLEEVRSITERIVVGSEDHMIMHNHVTVLALLDRIEEARPWARQLLDAGWQRPEFLQLCAQHALVENCAAPVDGP